MNEITLSPLPYADNALEPTISSRTISFHYGKHHAGYVNTLKGLVAGTKYEGLSLGEIVVASRAAGDAAIFNNAAQAWNHDFYWNSLAPAGKGGEPSSALKAAVDAAFGSLDACRAALADAAVKRFGSGWAWLVAKDGKLSVESTANADTPFGLAGVKPLLVVDVWEHAYYLDWQNQRAAYAKAVVEKHLDWRCADMRVKLIQPLAATRPMDTSLKARMAPHLGLLTIARIVEDCGHEVVVVNENSAPDIPSGGFDLVGISASIDVLDRARVLDGEYRRLGVPVVVGGIGVTSNPDLASEMFETICIGPAEGHWRDVLADAAAGRLRRRYETPMSFSGERLLAPSFRSVDTRGCLYDNVIAASRGCPFACDFCYNAAVRRHGGGYVHRTVESVASEVRSKATRHIMFIDDNFIGSPAFTRELLAALRPMRLKWSAAVSANILDMPDLLDLMAETGCQSLFIGFESVNPESLSGVGKGQNKVSRFEALAEALHSRGIMVNASFVFGLDADDPSTFDRTVEWVVANRIETVTSHIATPYPGTPFYDRMRREGRIIDDDLSHYDTAHVVIRPKNMTPEELYEGYLRVYREVYTLGNIWRRLPRARSQLMPYLLFNLFYRKWGAASERLGHLIGFDRVGALARRAAYFIR